MHKIAVIPGDGIGPEVVNEALALLEEIVKQDSLTLKWEVFDWGSEYYLQHGRMMPEESLDQLRASDAILFGAIGDTRVPDDVTIWELIMPIRKQFQQYINYRPARQLDGIQSPLQSKKDIDFVIIRENAEGEYSNMGGHVYKHTNQEVAVQNTVMTREGCEKVGRYAFDFAKENNYKMVTSATKSNAIVHTMELWDRCMTNISEDYPEVAFDSVYIDALAASMVQHPEKFGVVVASNLFGDILSDLGSAVVGGLGVSPSANINPEGTYPSMFEPVHGSAPDIAGKGIANPIAQIWSLALLFDHLGYTKHANIILSSIESTVRDQVVTPDLGGSFSTQEVGQAIRERVAAAFQEVE
ncbi:tartrate dehydrogenase [Halobacillus sp. A5]|uniref:tartrate dehydrogenase n=1 Tax=Halobacillus sp. A5 TaxID=2880263 RepID=UPI0020A6759C|nr:tartrate dehydrogenase [Halobacillus sp. A5]MCP3027900.1 tartrate dehydrogenase [Halobacillus sp. A5]